MKTISLCVVLLALAVFASAAKPAPKPVKDILNCGDVDSAIGATNYNKPVDTARLAELNKRHAALNCGKEKECPVIDKKMAEQEDGWARKMIASRRQRLACPGAEPAPAKHVVKKKP